MGVYSIRRCVVGNDLISTKDVVIKLCEYLWSYKRNFHVIGPIINENVSTGRLDTAEYLEHVNGIDVDVVINGVETYINLRKRDQELHVSGRKRCNYRVEVFTSDGLELEFSFKSAEDIGNVYVSYCRNRGLVQCAGCNKVNICRSGSRLIYVHDNPCKINEVSNGGPISYLKVAMDMVALLNKDVDIVHRYSNASSINRIMIAHESNDTDSESLIPLSRYVYTSEDGKRPDYKGGHHASPVSHPRRGYYRKSNVGDHVLIGEEYVKVEKGLGNYTFVGPTVVNGYKDIVSVKVARKDCTVG